MHSTNKYPHLLLVSKLLKNCYQITSHKNPRAESQFSGNPVENSNAGWPASLRKQKPSNHGR